MSKSIEEKSITSKYAKKCINTIAKLLNPFTPHISFSLLSATGDDALCPSWPGKIDGINISQEVEIIIQINGKLRSRIKTQSGLTKEEILIIVNNDTKTREYLDNSEVLKTIYVENKLINFVTK